MAESPVSGVLEYSGVYRMKQLDHRSYTRLLHGVTQNQQHL